MRRMFFAFLLLSAFPLLSAPPNVSTFSIVAADPAAGEVGIAVASRFFSVGSVVPWGQGGVGAVATQAYANTSFGPRGLELLARGATPKEIADILLRNDENPSRRQFGIVSADGSSTTYTGPNCTPWAGGRSGPGYAVQGNILTGEDVVVAMERAFLDTKGTLADRMFNALIAGDAKGGDSRGKQSASLTVWKPGAGYGGNDDRAVDVRVDDHPEPFRELGRLLNYAQMNYAWNAAWTLFTGRKFSEALPHMERSAQLAPENAEVLYDLAVIRAAAGKKSEALDALEKALRLNPKLRAQAKADKDMDVLRGEQRFGKIVD